MNLLNLKDKHLKSLICTVCAGLVLLLVIAIAVTKGFNSPAENSGGWFYEYQTLIAALIALFIGRQTIYIIKEQIEEDGKQHKETLQKNEIQFQSKLRTEQRQHQQNIIEIRRQIANAEQQHQDNLLLSETREIQALERKRRAIRAQMPDALSELLDYAQNCLRYIINEIEELPTKDQENIKVFKEGLEYLDENSFEGVRELVTFYQVYNSRLRGYEREEARTSQFKDRLGDTVQLAFLLNRIFSYARFREDFVSTEPPEWIEFFNAYTSLLRMENEIELQNRRRDQVLLREYFDERWGRAEQE